MAYNFCVVQRLSDGKYQTRTGGWDNLNFTNNYTNARFYYSDADDVQNYITNYPVGDYRVVEYWMPGKPATNKPKSNSTILNNFMGSLYSANTVPGDLGGDRFVTNDATDRNAISTGLANRLVVWLVFSEEQIGAGRIEGALPGAEVGGASYPDSFYLQIIRDFGRGNYQVGGFGSLRGVDIPYEIISK